MFWQISTLVEHRGDGGGGGGILRSSSAGASSTGPSPATWSRVGQAVSVAVERFVTVGETIADDHAEIRQGMYDACKEARQAGKSKHV